MREFVGPVGVGDLGLAEGDAENIVEAAVIQRGHQQRRDRTAQTVARHPGRALFVEPLENPRQALLLRAVEARVDVDAWQQDPGEEPAALRHLAREEFHLLEAQDSRLLAGGAVWAVSLSETGR